MEKDYHKVNKMWHVAAKFRQMIVTYSSLKKYAWLSEISRNML